jgi:hypothetical protein
MRESPTSYVWHSYSCPRALIRGIADHAGINGVYDGFGPVPWLCIDIFGKKEKFRQYKLAVHKAILNITLEQLARLFEDASSLHPDYISHKICLISREDRNDVTSDPVVSPITSSIQT